MDRVLFSPWNPKATNVGGSRDKQRRRWLEDVAIEQANAKIGLTKRQLDEYGQRQRATLQSQERQSSQAQQSANHRHAMQLLSQSQTTENPLQGDIARARKVYGVDNAGGGAAPARAPVDMQDVRRRRLFQEAEFERSKQRHAETHTNAVKSMYVQATPGAEPFMEQGAAAGQGAGLIGETARTMQSEPFILGMDELRQARAARLAATTTPQPAQQTPQQMVAGPGSDADLAGNIHAFNARLAQKPLEQQRAEQGSIKDILAATANGEQIPMSRAYGGPGAGPAPAAKPAPDPTGEVAARSVADEMLARIKAAQPGSVESKKAMVLYRALMAAQGKVADMTTGQAATSKTPLPFGQNMLEKAAPTGFTGQGQDASQFPAFMQGSAPQQATPAPVAVPLDASNPASVRANLSDQPIMQQQPAQQVYQQGQMPTGPAPLEIPQAGGQGPGPMLAPNTQEAHQQYMQELDQNIDYWMKSFEKAGGTAPVATAATAPKTPWQLSQDLKRRVEEAKLGGFTEDLAGKKQTREQRATEFARKQEWEAADRDYQMALRMPAGEARDLAIRDARARVAQAEALPKRTAAETANLGGGGAKGREGRIADAVTGATVALSRHLGGRLQLGQVENDITKILDDADPRDMPTVKRKIQAQLEMMAPQGKNETPEQADARAPEVARLATLLNNYGQTPASGQGPATPQGAPTPAAGQVRQIVARARAKVTANNAISELAAGGPLDEASLAETLQMKLAPVVKELIASGVKPEDAADIAWGAIAQSPAWKNEQFSWPLQKTVPYESGDLVLGHSAALAGKRVSLPDQSPKYRGVAATAKKALLKTAFAKKATQIPVGG